MAETIFMPLLNEGTDVWVPVNAERLSDGSFRIQGKMPGDQTWKFPPGSIVDAESRLFDNVESLAALKLSR